VKRNTNPKRLLEFRHIHVGRHVVENVSKNVHTHVSSHVTPVLARLVYIWVRHNLVSVVSIKPPNDVPRPITILDGVAERFAVRRWPAASTFALDHVMRVLVVLVKFVCPLAAIAGKWKRTFCAVIAAFLLRAIRIIDWKPAKSSRRPGLDCSSVKTCVKGISIAVFISAQSNAIRKIRNLVIVRDLLI
jgi:uncharacterized membrane protein YphA (DoxX/SURF4 family)